MRSSVLMSSRQSELKRAFHMSRPLRRLSALMESGSSIARGMRVPSTSMGMTRMSRLSAVSISRRTKSSGSSRRLWPSSCAFNQSLAYYDYQRLAISQCPFENMYKV